MLVFRHIPLSYTVSIFSALLAYLIVLDGMLGLSSECRYINCHRRFGGEVFCVRDAPVSEDAAAEVILSGTANAEWQEAVMPLYSMHMGAALNTTARISMSTASQVTIGWLEAARTWGLSFTVWHASSSRAVVWKLEQADGTRTALSDISLAFAFGSLCPLCLSRLLAHALETRYFAEKCLPFVGWVLPRAQAITSGCYAHCRLHVGLPAPGFGGSHVSTHTRSSPNRNRTLTTLEDNWREMQFWESWRTSSKTSGPAPESWLVRSLDRIIAVQ